MTTVVDLLQAKCGTIDASISAPTEVKYPEGRIDSWNMPLVLTHLVSGRPDVSASLLESRYQIVVYTATVGEESWRQNKKDAHTWWTQFVSEFRITAANNVLQNDPPVRILPGTIQFSGYWEVVRAPDEEPFHGFTIDMLVSEVLDAICS